MTDTAPEFNATALTITGAIVSAYITHNHVAPTELPVLIASVHAAIAGLIDGGITSEVGELGMERPTSGQIRRSITRDVLISFIDGKGYKTLKRHLTVHGLTPDAYRDQFGLPSDYPMVSEAYSEIRSGLAKSIGLGVQATRRAAGEITRAAPEEQKIEG